MLFWIGCSLMLFGIITIQAFGDFHQRLPNRADRLGYILIGLGGVAVVIDVAMGLWELLQ